MSFSPNTTPTPMATPAPTPAATRKPKLGWIVVAVVAVIVLVAAFLLTRALSASSAPDTPGGLSVEAQPGQVTASWEAVSGAESYRLLRTDGVVAYSGPETTTVDKGVVQGEQSYQVVAVRKGSVSAPSVAQTVEVEGGWGPFEQFTAQFPNAISSPGPGIATDDNSCLARRGGTGDEVAAAPNGNGQLRTLFSVRCYDSSRNAYGLFWFANEDALNASYATYAENARPVRWAHGTGVIDDERDRGAFKITDDPERASVMVVVLGMGSDILDIANGLDLSAS